MQFNGLGMSLGNLPRLSDARTRSITAENPRGEKGGGARAEAAPDSPARELGKGWKCAPCTGIGPGQTLVLADIAGPGAIQSMWFAGGIANRDMILRIYWDGADQPAVECPLPDFFGVHFPMQDPLKPCDGPAVHINSLPVAVNPNRALNCFWEMPFRSRAYITLENRHPVNAAACFYQINYTLTQVPEDCGYFHAQFRRVNPLPYGEVYTILDNVEDEGHYVGTSMGYGVNNNGWWGEGEIKFYLDGDTDYPTLCGTGTEDYFGGAYNWEIDGRYTTYSTAFCGMHQVLLPDGLYNSQHRHCMYRWHIMDPIRFRQDIRVTIQALGWSSDGTYMPGTHDICSTAFWYSRKPAVPLAPLPDRQFLRIL